MKYEIIFPDELLFPDMVVLLSLRVSVALASHRAGEQTFWGMTQYWWEK